MRNLHYLIPTFFIFFWCNSLFAQQELDLAKAIQIGLRNNFQIQIANTEVELAQFKYKNAFRDRLPIIAINATQKNLANKVNSPTSFVDGFYKDYGIGGVLDANWIVFDGFRNRANKRQLENQKNLSQANLDLIIENSIQAILLAYYKTVIERENLKIVEELFQLSKEKLKDIRLQNSLGKVSMYEVLRFENAYLSDSSLFVFQKNEFNLAMQRLNLVLGNKNLFQYELIEPIRYLEKPFDKKSLTQHLIQSNRQIRNQMVNITLKKNMVALQKTNRYPIVRVSGGASRNWNAIKFDDFPRANGEDLNFYLNFTLSYNLFDGGITSREVEVRKIETEIEKFKLEDLKRNLQSELEQHIQQYNSQLEIVLINEKLVENLLENLDMLNGQIESGFASALEYRIVQLEYLNAQRTRLDSIQQLKELEVMIARLTGGLKNN